jgi:hypothetical protein
MSDMPTVVFDLNRSPSTHRTASPWFAETADRVARVVNDYEEAAKAWTTT